jgi:hypothetical protein
MSESTEADHERIWLEPGGYGPEGRLWCQDNVWGSRCVTEYVRADLMEAAIATARAEERAEFARLAQSEEMVEKIAKALYDDWRDEIDPPADEPWEEAEGFQALWKQRARHVLAALFRKTEVTP